MALSQIGQDVLKNTGYGVGTNTGASYGVGKSMGTVAKTPEQNIAKPVNKITPAQTKTPVQAKAPVVSSQIAKAQAPVSTPATNKATLYGPTGQKQVVDVGSSQASQLQSQGWGLTAGSYKAPNQGVVGQQIAKAQNPVSANISDATKPTTTPTPMPTNYGGTVQALTNTAINQSPVVGQATTGLLNTAQANMGNTGPAYEEYQKAIRDLETLKGGVASQTRGISTNTQPLQVQQGEQGAANIQNASLLDAAQQRVNAAASALGYQIQGTQTQQAGYNQAGGLGNTAQGLAQSGLATSAGLQQPMQVPYGTPLVSPVTGQNVSQTGEGISQSDPFYQTMQSYAQLLASNQGSAIPSTITGNSVLNAQLLQMAKQINPNFNVNVAQGAGAAQEQIAGSQSQQIQGYQSALQQGQNLQAQLNDLLSRFGLNPSDINKANQGLQVIANNTSDPKYQTLQNYINDIANTYSQILTPPGGSATNQTRDIASSMLNSTMSGKGLVEVMKSLDAAANAKIAGVGTAGGIGKQGSSDWSW